LTEKHGLYFATGKENVKVNRPKEPDKTKYEIFDVLKAAVPKCRNWKELDNVLKRQGITTSFKTKGNTDEVQGVMFEKNKYKFNGSKIDRQFSYSKIDYQLKQNSREQEQAIHQPFKPEHSQNVGSSLGGLFDIPISSGMDYDPEEAELLRQHKYKKKKKTGHHF